MTASVAYLALGTNLGDRAANLRRALAVLPPEFDVQAVSPVYETEPAYVQDQPRFFNLVCRTATSLGPLAALRRLKTLEVELGRTAGPRFGPRLIDLDLLLYDQIQLETDELTLPHPRLAERAFVLVPFADLEPDLVPPGLGLTVRALRDRLGDTRGQLWPVSLQLAPSPPSPMPARAAASLTLGASTFRWGRQTFVMGIVNVTPDSFSGDGVAQGGDIDDWVAAAVAHGQAQVAAGAHFLDVGGESTRPGSAAVPLADELRRVVPVVTALAQAVSVPLSVDTYKAEVANQALAAGAGMVNDVWALRMDPRMAQVVAEHGAAVVLMHNRSRPKDAEQSARLGGRYVGVEYADLLGEIRRELQASLDLARAAGIAEDRILIDPGIGFGKTVEQNLELLYRLDELSDLGFPLLVGPSRKSFVGYTLNLPPDQRVEGTAAAVALAVDRGADVVRVHDVGAMLRVTRLADAVVRGRPSRHSFR